MQNQRDYYGVLRVRPDASTECIRTSYRVLMQQLKMHPDLGGSHGQAVLINEAFATLRDPKKRAAYDRARTFATGHGAGTRPNEPRPQPRPAAAPPRPAAPSAAPSSKAEPKAARKDSPRAEAPRLGSGRPAVPMRTLHRVEREAPRATCECLFCGASHVASAVRQPTAVCWRCDSPLFPAVKHPRGISAGRAFNRMPRKIAVTVSVAGASGRRFESATKDVSISGVSFPSAEPLPAGQRVKVDCAYYAAVGVVRHARPEPGSRRGRWRIGIEFLTLLVKEPRGMFVSTQA